MLRQTRRQVHRRRWKSSRQRLGRRGRAQLRDQAYRQTRASALDRQSPRLDAHEYELTADAAVAIDAENTGLTIEYGF